MRVEAGPPVPGAAAVAGDQFAGAPRRRWTRVLLVVALVVGGATLVLALGALALLAALPGVGDAPARVAAIQRQHGGEPVGLPLPSRLASSIVAVEDQRFYHHHGIDLRSVTRVAWAGLRGRSWEEQGGSTLSQQLAKRVYTGDRRGVKVKVEQLGLAVKLERRYSKQQILRMYMDVAYFGSGHWGVVQASEGYFDKPPTRLGWGEASLLAGLVQAPSVYDPTVNLTAARRRQAHVLDRLVAGGTLSRSKATAASRALAAEAPRLGFKTVGGG